MCYFICPVGNCAMDDYETMLQHIQEKPGDKIRINRNVELMVGKNYCGRIILGWLGGQVAYTWAHCKEPYVAWCEPKTILAYIVKNS